MPWSRFITIVVGLGLAIGLKFLLSRDPPRRRDARGGRQPRARRPQRHQARPGLDVLVGARLVDGRGRRHLPRRGARHPRRADAHAADPRRVRGRDHRPAQEPAAHLHGRSADRPRVRVPAELPELDAVAGPPRRSRSRRSCCSSRCCSCRRRASRARRRSAAWRPRIPSMLKARRSAWSCSSSFALFLGLVASSAPTSARSPSRCSPSLIMVSMVPLTGWSKQISLAQITFVGAGAFAYLEWAPSLGSVGRLFGGRAVRDPVRGGDGACPRCASRASTSRWRRWRSRRWPRSSSSRSPRSSASTASRSAASRSSASTSASRSRSSASTSARTSAPCSCSSFAARRRGAWSSCAAQAAVSAADSPRWATARPRAPRSASTRSSPSSACSSSRPRSPASPVRCSASSRARPPSRTSRCSRASAACCCSWSVASRWSAARCSVASSSRRSRGSPTQFPGNTLPRLVAAPRPGLAGIGIGRQPSGIIPTVGQEHRDKKARKRAERQGQGPPPPPDALVGAPSAAARRRIRPASVADARRLTRTSALAWSTWAVMLPIAPGQIDVGRLPARVGRGGRRLRRRVGVGRSSTWSSPPTTTRSTRTRRRRDAVGRGAGIGLSADDRPARHAGVRRRGVDGTVKLGTCVVVAPLHSPAVLAKRVVDHRQPVGRSHAARSRHRLATRGVRGGRRAVPPARRAPRGVHGRDARALDASHRRRSRASTVVVPSACTRRPQPARGAVPIVLGRQQRRRRSTAPGASATAGSRSRSAPTSSPRRRRPCGRSRAAPGGIPRRSSSSVWPGQLRPERRSSTPTIVRRFVEAGASSRDHRPLRAPGPTLGRLAAAGCPPSANSSSKSAPSSTSLSPELCVGPAA